MAEHFLTLGFTSTGKRKHQDIETIQGPGYKFLPSDDDLLVHLSRKLENSMYASPDIKVADVYQHHPMSLTGLHCSKENDTWYFFHKSSSDVASRPGQPTGKGLWRSCTETSILGHATIIGFKAYFDFIEEKHPGPKIEWAMEQYHHAANLEANSWSLCKFYRKALQSADDGALSRSLPLSKGTSMNVKKLEDDHDWSYAPTDVKLMGYLNKKLKDPMHRNQKIIEANVYHYHPKDLIDLYGWTGETCWFFFCPKNLSTYKTRTHRRAVGGFWDGNNTEEPVCDDNKEVGLKKTFTFAAGDRSNKKPTDWKMVEYRNPSSNEVTSYVLCKIYIYNYKKKQVKLQVQKQPGPCEDEDKSLSTEKRQRVLLRRRTV